MVGVEHHNAVQMLKYAGNDLTMVIERPSDLSVSSLPVGS
jgi:hypothetical protein